jgi:triosephosphate isomerase
MATDIRPVFAGNWKLFGTMSESVALATAVQSGLADAGSAAADAEVIVAPGFLAITAVVTAVAERLPGGPVAVAGQNCSAEEQGAFTGEVSARQLADAGCRYVILGHSERRQLFGETDAGVARKLRAALGAGLRPIVCVGETLAERDGGKTLDRVGAQLDAMLEVVTPADLGRCMVAYEPVWAIGTGRTATPAQAEEVHLFIRGRIGGKEPALAPLCPILYGGSVKPDNIRALMAEKNVDGALVGGASLSAESFLRIVKEGSDVWSRS